jgi:hypothetical protein
MPGAKAGQIGRHRSGAHGEVNMRSSRDAQISCLNFLSMSPANSYTGAWTKTFFAGSITMKLTTIGYAVAIAAVLAFGASGPSFAAKKKMAKEAPPPPILCVQPDAPVCASKGGMSFTYANSCYAEKDGAKVTAKGACKAPKAHMKSAKKMAKPAAKPAMKKKPADKK